MSNDRPRLLLVDDQAQVVWHLGRILAREGFAVTTCSDGFDALLELEAKEFDIMVTDLQMPRVSGIALLEWARQNRPLMRLAVITAFGSPTVREVCLSKGAIVYLEKPVDPKLLVEVLRSETQPSTFSGTVGGIDLFDYVQLVLVSKGRLRLEVTASDGTRGLLFIDGGNVPHAVCGSIQGEEAFFECLGFESGSFASLPWKEPPVVTIDCRGDYLLVEAARRKDETAHGVRKPEAAGRADHSAKELLQFSTADWDAISGGTGD